MERVPWNGPFAHEIQGQCKAFERSLQHLDYAFGNQLDISEGSLTGRIRGDVIDAALMLGQAGLGIAYNAQKALNRVAAGNIAHSRMTNILYILGVTETDIDKLI